MFVTRCWSIGSLNDQISLKIAENVVFHVQKKLGRR